MSATTPECADPISVDEASAQQVRLSVCQLQRCSRRALCFLDAEPHWRTWAACAGAWASLSACASRRATCSSTSVAGGPQQLSRGCAQTLEPRTVPAHRVARVARCMLLCPSTSAPPASVCQPGGRLVSALLSLTTPPVVRRLAESHTRGRSLPCERVVCVARCSVSGQRLLLCH